jgi:hypothetical protein
MGISLSGITLPKIAVGTIIGDYVNKNVPGGAAIVAAVDTTIDVVKDAKLQPGVILTKAGQTGAAAAVASVQSQVNASVQKSAQSQALAGLTGNSGLVIAVVVLLGFLLLRKRG